jgi:S-formylglutathione hydrolase FrmB
MPLIHCDFHSNTLGLSSSMCVVLPEPSAHKGPHKTLWLLHGLSDDHTIWQRRTSIERYAAPLNLAVVMPAVARSYYTDMARGLRYWTYLSEELPAAARAFFPLSDRRDDNFVAGLSMGGYGAFKLALRHPDRFAAAASLSGALDLALRGDDPALQPDHRLELENVFGDLSKFRGSDNDLFALAERLVNARTPRPRLYACCGADDFLLDHNRRFRDHAARIGLDLTYEEGPGAHDWAFWDHWIQRVLQWLLP